MRVAQPPRGASAPIRCWPILAGAAILVLLSGCVAPMPQVSRADYLKMTSRDVPAPKERVLEAAEKVMRLSDGDDYTIHHHKAGFNAQRRWSFYVVIAAGFGTDFWAIRADEYGADKTKLEVEVGTSAQPIVPMMTTAPGVWTASTLPANATPNTGPAIYELFFERLDYLLGRRAEWPTCEWAKERVKSKEVWGSIEPLCNPFNVNDETPKEPLFKP